MTTDYDRKNRAFLLTELGLLIGEKVDGVEVGEYDATLIFGNKRVRIYPTNTETLSAEVTVRS